MQKPQELLKRSEELTARADAESSPELRQRLQTMAAHYAHLAENEQWLADHPVSADGIGNLFRT